MNGASMAYLRARTAGRSFRRGMRGGRTGMVISGNRVRRLKNDAVHYARARGRDIVT